MVRTFAFSLVLLWKRVATSRSLRGVCRKHT
jgi:hypothetical protein